MRRRGFTLVELLVVISIIGLLATVGIVSYSTARQRARDAKRLADLDTVHNALELWATDHGGYPTDGQIDEIGLTLGVDAKTLLDEGWANHNSPTYLNPVPQNPGPFGAEYKYVSLNADGTHCTKAPCANYRVEFALEGDTAGLKAGPAVQGPNGFLPPTPAIADSINARTKSAGTSQIAEAGASAVQAAVAVQHATIDNPTVEFVSTAVAVPVSTVAAVANTATTVAASTATAAGAAAQAGQYLYLIFTQPLLLLRKKKQYAWGIVYNSQTKLPIDLAIIRIVDAKTARAIQTRVTDMAGRYFFFAPTGTYKIEVVKPGFDYPSAALKGASADGKFGNLYFGDQFTVSGAGAAVNPSIPLDPSGLDVPDSKVVARFVRRQFQHVVALSGFFISLGTFVITPTVFVGGLLIVHVILFMLFRRLSRVEQPTDWGVVTDEKTKKPVTHAVVRIFSLPYNKLLETRVADRRGRYNFLVGQNLYYLTASKQGYWKTETYPLDLRGIDHPQVIAVPLPLRSGRLPPAESAKVDITAQNR